MAGWTVGADGTRSSVSRLVGADRGVRFPRRIGLVAHYSGTGDLTEHGEMHVGPGYYVGLAPTPGGELNVGMALPMDRGRGSARRRFEAAIAGLPSVARRLAGSARLTPIRGAAPIGHRVSAPAGPGWLLVGDAAGFVDPFTGEGIHRALRSARAAADAILAGGDVAARLSGRAPPGIRGQGRAELAGPGIPGGAAAARVRRPPAGVPPESRAATRLGAGRLPAGDRRALTRARWSRCWHREEHDPPPDASPVGAHLSARRGGRALAADPAPLPIRPTRARIRTASAASRWAPGAARSPSAGRRSSARCVTSGPSSSCTPAA